MVAENPVPASAGLLLVDRYRLDDRVAEGGMGEVWRATDLVLDRVIAVKLLRPGRGEREEELARFRAEARHAGSVSHPGIAQVYDYHDANPPSPPFLVMELVDGPSLAGLLEDGPIDPARTMDLIAQAAHALEAAHAVGLVHRDIKPGNLLLTRAGQLKITDFGIAHAADSVTLTRPGALIGTPAYLAPERAAGAPAAPAADLYALGIVAFQCLTGELPFTGEPLVIALAHQDRPFPPLPPSVPAEVAALVAGLTAKDPGARPGSAAEVAQRAERVRAVLAATAPLPLTRRDWRRLAGHPGRPAMAAAAVATVAMAGWALTSLHGPTPGGSQGTPPAASPRPSPRASQPTTRTVPGAAGTTGALARDGRPSARKSLSAHVTHSTTPAPSGSATPSGTPAPGGTPTPSGSPAPSQTPAPSGTPTPTATPTPSGTPTPNPGTA
jgi:serine/threonine-protein kinase